MFISHFNRYFEKHAKATYLVLLIVIIATFVIFVTPGSLGGGPARLKDFGKMYGKTLGVEKMQKEMAKTTLGLWFQNPQFFGETFSSQGEALFQETLNRMRILHYAKAEKLDRGIADDDLRTRIQEIALVQDEDGRFDKENFDRLLEVCRTTLGLMPAEFDQVVREAIVIDRVLEKVRGEATVADEEVAGRLAKYTLQCHTVSLRPEDALPTEEEIQKFFQERRGEIQLPDSRNAQAAVLRYDTVRQQMGEQALPSEEEIAQRYEANKNTVYQGSELAQVKEEIRQTLASERVRARARALALELYRDFQVPVQDEKPQDRVKRFRAQAEAKGATVTATGMVSLGNGIQGLGNQPRLAEAIRNVPQPGGVTPMVPTDDFVAVAMVEDQQPTQMPASLPAWDGKEQDALRRVVSAAILREQALAFFQAKVKAPYENYTTQAKALQEDKSLTPSQRQQAIAGLSASLDRELVQRFYVPEARSFAQVTFSPLVYLDRVEEPAQEEVEAAFQERKAELEGKSLEEARPSLVEDLKAQKAYALAQAAAQEFAAQAADAWWQGQERQDGAADVSALLKQQAEKVPEAKFQVVEKLNPLTQWNASNSELLGALYQPTLTLTNPVSRAIAGLDECYVIGLTAIEEPHLTTPETDAEAYAALEQCYQEVTRMEAARARAEADKAQLEEALAKNGGDLKAAAGDREFAQLPAFSLNDIDKQSAVVTSIQQSKHISLRECAGELEKVKAAGVFLAPRRAEQSFSIGQGFQGIVIPMGYQLLYVSERTAPPAEESQTEEWKALRERLLLEKQNTHTLEFLQALEAESRTELRPDTPYTEKLSQE